MRLSDKIKTALDEARMLILGGQILLGFQYRAALQPGFSRLGQGCQELYLVALCLMLLELALLLAPGAYHRIVWEGEDERPVHEYATRLMDIALAPFALAFGADLYVVMVKSAGGTLATAAATLTTLAALACWYGPLLLREDPEDSGVSEEPTSLKDKVDQALTEIRVVLPGAQALLGFQLACTLMAGFERLPVISQRIHLVAMILMVLAVILLMSPPAYHRLVLRGEVTRRLHRFVNRVMLLAMVPMALSMSADLFVVSQKVLGSAPCSLLLSVAALALFVGLWFVYPFYARSRRPPLDPLRSHQRWMSIS